MASLVIITTEDVSGKILKKTVRNEFGVLISWLMIRNKKTKGRVRMKEDWLPSRIFGANAPIPAIRLPYKKKPRIK